MKINKYIFTAALMAFGFASNSQAVDSWSGSDRNGAKAGTSLESSDFCQSYFISGSVTGPGSTNGSFGDTEPGDHFVFNATGNGTGSWRIVGDPEGSVTFASGGTFPGTLTFTVQELGFLAPGVGFYVDDYTGDGDEIQGYCGDIPNPVPTASTWALWLLVLAVGMFGSYYTRRLKIQQIG